MTDQRPVRMCDTCGGVDDHPRHVFAGSAGEGVTDPAVAKSALKAAGDDNYDVIYAQVTDTSTVMRHMDCCREAGCPDGTCDTVTRGAEDLRGEELVNHLVRRDSE